MDIAETDEEIAACFPVMKVLRPNLEAGGPAGFVARVRLQQKEGYILAYRKGPAGAVVTVSGFRFQEMLSRGRIVYIDDLVTAPEARGAGHGGALLEDIVALAVERGCDQVHLDSGHGRHDAHRLYLNHGFKITSHHFARNLGGGGAAG